MFFVLRMTGWGLKLLFALFSTYRTIVEKGVSKMNYLTPMLYLCIPFPGGDTLVTKIEIPLMASDVDGGAT